LQYFRRYLGFYRDEQKVLEGSEGEQKMIQ
jgi:hypothetical protein